MNRHVWILGPICFAIGACLAGCPQAVPVVGPAANLAACIATEVLKQDPIVTIAAVCGVDVLTVITDVLGSDDPAVHASFAYKEAAGIKATMKAAP